MSRLRVGIDVSPLVQTRAGTARYVTELVAQLEANASLELRRYRFGGRSRPAKIVRDVGWYLAVLPAQARRDRLDVLHCPSYRAPIRTSVPLVATFHDIAVLRHPGAFNRWTRSYSAFALPGVARAAAAIITGSEFSRRELVELLGVPERKVRVIPYGVGAPFAAEGPASEGDFVLAVSTLEPRKNLARLVEAFHRAELDGCELRVVGARGWGDVQIGGDGVAWVGEVSDEELARLYRGARCVAYVSLYEGFGLPVLEAMACGTPVVTSSAAPFREFADGVAVAVDPRDPESIAAGLRDAIGRGAELGPLGRERARAYDWKSAAEATLDVYREVAR